MTIDRPDAVLPTRSFRGTNLSVADLSGTDHSGTDHSSTEDSHS